MSMFFFTYRAATQARMGADILKQAGISARVDRMPAGLGKQGCGYGLWVRPDQARRAAEALRIRHSPFQKVYEIRNEMAREVRL